MAGGILQFISRYYVGGNNCLFTWLLRFKHCSVYAWKNNFVDNLELKSLGFFRGNIIVYVY